MENARSMGLDWNGPLRFYERFGELSTKLVKLIRRTSS